MAEVGGLSISIRETPIPGDVAGETNSAWTIDLVAESGATCTLSWCTLRRWNRAKVAFERHLTVRILGDATLGHQEDARELGSQLFLGIVEIGKPVALIQGLPVETLAGARQ